MSRIRTIQRLGAAVAIAVLALALPASAAELLTAELEGTANEVTVEQGKSQNFNISLSASGNVACGSTHSAQVHKSYTVSAAGAVSSETLSSAVNFTAPSGSGNCNITWTGAPTPQTVAAAVSAAATTPVGTYTVILKESNGNTATSSSNSSGGKLDDNDPTTLTIRVVAPTVSQPANTAPTVTVTGVADNASYEVGSVPAAGCNVVDAEDGNTAFAASLSAITGPLSAYGIGSQTASCSYTDLGALTGSATATYSIVDTTDPTVAVTGFTPGQVFVYAVDALPTAGCDTQDAGSGVATSASASSSGGPLGTVTVTCSGAVDRAGNSAAPVSESYHVRYGRSGGIGQPINPDGSSQFNQKRAVPVKFALQGDEPSGFAVSGFTLYRTGVSCPGGVLPDDEAAAQPVTTSTTWRYDSVDDQYVFNASLAGTTVGKCYQYQVDLGDGGARVASATFKVTK